MPWQSTVKDSNGGQMDKEGDEEEGEGGRL
jgi:hypothetical protein